MQILSSFTHPPLVPNLYEFNLLNTIEDILKNVGNLPYYFSILCKSMAMSTIWLLALISMQNVFFCVQQLKEIHTDLEQPEGKQMMTIFIFG